MKDLLSGWKAFAYEGIIGILVVLTVVCMFSACDQASSPPVAEKLTAQLVYPIYGPCSVVAQDKWYIIGGRVSKKVREGIDPYFTGYNIDVMQVINMETGRRQNHNR